MLPTFIWFFLSCRATEKSERQNEEQGEAIEFAHDPSRFYREENKLYSYCSGRQGVGLQGLELDLVAREIRHTTAVDANQIATGWWDDIQIWNPTAEFDAPAVTDNGQFLLFTVFDEADDQIQDAIGVAENSGSHAEPIWTDMGIVVQSFDEEETTPRAMDPSVITDEEQMFMVFGSHAGGIYITELNSNTLKLSVSPEITSSLEQPERFIKIADNVSEEEEGPGGLSGIEAPYIHKHGNYYYLFVNVGRCCSGIDSTYEVWVGRSLNAVGPYVDKSNTDMRNAGGTPFLSSSDRYIGPEHIGIYTAEQGGDIVTYHFYDGDDNGVAKVDAKRLTWVDGWPLPGESLVDW